jgi:hypothetical protein
MELSKDLGEETSHDRCQARGETGLLYGAWRSNFCDESISPGAFLSLIVSRSAKLQTPSHSRRAREKTCSHLIGRNYVTSGRVGRVSDRDPGLAALCKSGDQLVEFRGHYGIRYEARGKLIVATTAPELALLQKSLLRVHAE